MTQRTCRACGCTESHACHNDIDGACWWIAPDLCSHCQLTAAALGAKINVAQDLGGDLVSLELRHALQLQKMTTWLLQLPTANTIDQIYACVQAVAAKANA
jgi:hypothetical protein